MRASIPSVYSVTQLVSRRDSRLAAILALGVFLTYLAFLSPAPSSIDEDTTVRVAESLVTQHNFTVPPNQGKLGREGRYYSRWYPLSSIVAIPAVALGYGVSAVVHVPAHYAAAFFCLALSALLSAATAGFVSLIALRIGGSASAAISAGLAYAFGTIAFTYARTFFADPLLALLSAASIFFAFGITRPSLTICVGLCALSVLAKPPGIVLGPVLSAYLLVRDKSVQRAIGPLIGTCTGLALYGLYNWSRFGSPLDFGQPPDFTLKGFGEALTGLLVSPRAGLLWYCPIVLSITALARSAWRQLELLALTLVPVAYLVLHATWVWWAGGWSWGPRLLLSALPALLAMTALLTSRASRRRFAALAMIGFVVNAPMLISSFKRYHAETAAVNMPDSRFTWSLPDSPLVNAWGVAARQIEDAKSTDVRLIVRNSGIRDRSAMSQNSLKVVTLWWWMLPAAGLPRWIGVIASLLLLIVGIWVMTRTLLAARNFSELEQDDAPASRIIEEEASVVKWTRAEAEETGF
jgi:hypothetical protein